MKNTILLFIAGAITPEMKASAQSAGAMIRDPDAWHPGDTMEVCTSVGGDVPAQYLGVDGISVLDDASVAEAMGVSVEDEQPGDGLDSLSVAKLKKALADGNVDIPTGAKKPELVELLREALLPFSQDSE